MSAGCARCGSCCDPVTFAREAYDAVVKWSASAMAGVPDPGTDEGWPHWLAGGYTEDQRAAAIRRYAPGSITRQDADFLAAHWKPIDDKTCACDAYDREARLCTAQDSKPPVCRDYPWYGRDPGSEDGKGMPLHCSYLADMPPDKRPEGARPLIPLTVVTRVAA